MDGVGIEWPCVTLCIPYYRNRIMLAEQLKRWESFPQEFRFIVVDDGSPEPAYDVVKWGASDALRDRLELYRVLVDIKWNRGGARNLASWQAMTRWIIHADIDHTMEPEAAAALLRFKPKHGCWYRFPRFRVGAADETRKKDALDPQETFGAIKPHCDSYLVQRSLYWKVGGYDEDYSGCLGGGSPFLAQLSQAGTVMLAPDDAPLHVHTRSSVADASDFSLSRDTSEYSRRRKAKEVRGDVKAHAPIRFEWKREL